jgi:UDP-N-acetylglucosamine--N-acetylmuramyl-(pentapeptide) pyrophosphoryl-undecaprenol N-acetylglucosamine transferase
MPELMARADLVVCRAGVGTIAELTAVGLPAIVVPGQFGGAHQVDNAQLLASAGVAEVISDAGLTTATLIRAIDSLTDDRLAAMAVASRAMGRPHAAASVLKVLRSVAARR